MECRYIYIPTDGNVGLYSVASVDDERSPRAIDGVTGTSTTATGVLYKGIQ